MQSDINNLTNNICQCLEKYRRLIDDVYAILREEYIGNEKIVVIAPDVVIDYFRDCKKFAAPVAKSLIIEFCGTINMVRFINKYAREYYIMQDGNHNYLSTTNRELLSFQCEMLKYLDIVLSLMPVPIRNEEKSRVLFLRGNICKYQHMMHKIAEFRNLACIIDSIYKSD